MTRRVAFVVLVALLGWTCVGCAVDPAPRASDVAPGAAAATRALAPAAPAGRPRADDALAALVDDVAQALLAAHDAPGLAIGAVAAGARRSFCYGVADAATGRPVDDATLFEIGSISKTFTATLAAFAEATGALALDAPVRALAPELAGTCFDRVPLRALGTYTAGGLPLQFPDHVGADAAAAFAYYRAWRPDHAVGTHRVYSNPSIGLLGHLAARSLGQTFADALEGELLPRLRLAATFVRVPAARAADRAVGRAADGAPARLAPGPMGDEAYGVLTTVADLLRWVELQLDPTALEPTVQRAIATTRLAHHRVGPLHQGLGWELCAADDLEALLATVEPDLALTPREVEPFPAPRALEGDGLVGKTGGTRGFSAYVLFAPARATGVVLLANRNIPAAARVRAAHRILRALGSPATASPR